MQDNHFDILIIGAGPVGATLAIALSKLSLRIGVIESKSIPTNYSNNSDGRSIALNYASCQTLEKLNIWQRLASYSTPIKEVHVSQQGHFAFTRIRAHEENVSALGYVVPAAVLTAEINKKFLSLTNIKLFNPAKVIALEKLVDNYELTMELNNEKLILHTKLIIGADGTYSTIRQLADIAIETYDYEQTAIATTVNLTRSHHHVAYERFIQDGAIAMLPLQDNRCGCVWTLCKAKAEELLALSDSEFLALTQKIFGYRLGRLLEVGKRHTHPLSKLTAKQTVKDGIVLLGNAAHTLHPIAAQGFNLGLSDIIELVKLLNIHGINFKELQNYQINREKQVNWTMNFTDSLTKNFNIDFMPVNILRNLSLFAIDVFSPLKHRLAKKLMGRG